MLKIRKFFRQFGPILIPAIGVVGGILVLFMLIIPLLQKSLDLYQKISKFESDISSLTEKVSLLASLDESAIDAQLDALVDALPSSKLLPSVMSTLDGLNGQTGTSLLDLTFTGGKVGSDSAQTKVTKGNNSFPVTVSLAGDYAQLVSFIAQAPKVKRLLAVIRFTFNFQNNNIGKADVTLEALYAPVPLTDAKNRLAFSPLTPREEEEIAEIMNFPNFGKLSQVEPAPQSGGLPRPDPFSL